MTPDEREDLLRKNWMTHDAMWFFHTLQECGIETANKINHAAIRAMAAVEVRRITKILGIGEIRTLTD
jgi:hypothetical protein